MSQPEKLTKNEILRQHGPFGGLVRTLQRYTIAGWVLFVITLLALIVVSIASTLAPRPVVAVDESGRVLGALEYLSPASRSDEELTASCKRFASRYLSLNSETIFEDYAEAMNMMGEQMLTDTQAALSQDNYLARVRAAKARSRIEFARSNGATILGRNGLTAECRLVGEIHLENAEQRGSTTTPFDLTLGVQIVARNTANTAGIKITSRKDN